MRPDTLLYNMALAAMTKAAMDPGMMTQASQGGGGSDVFNSPAAQIALSHPEGGTITTTVKAGGGNGGGGGMGGKAPPVPGTQAAGQAMGLPELNPPQAVGGPPQAG